MTDFPSIRIPRYVQKLGGTYELTICEDERGNFVYSYEPPLTEDGEHDSRPTG